MWKHSVEIAGSESSRVLNEAWTEHRVRLVITQSFWVMSRVFMTSLCRFFFHETDLFFTDQRTQPLADWININLSNDLEHCAELWNVLFVPETDVVSMAFESKLSRSFQHDGAPEIERSKFRVDDEWKRNVGMEMREKTWEIRWKFAISGSAKC